MKNLKFLKLIIIILLELLLISLSIWQINRFNSKRNIDFLNLSNNNFTKLQNSKNFQYKLLKLEGIFLYNKEIYLYRSFKANNNSKKNIGTFMVLTPFQINDGNIIMVLRGLVLDNKNYNNSINQSTIKLTGISIPGEKDSLFIESFDKQNNIWFAINLNKIQKTLEEDIITSYYLVAKPEESILAPNLNPINYQDYLNLSKANYWHHLFYAINWFIMAIVLFLIYMCKKI